MKQKGILIGTDDFKKIRDQGAYYVDKTGLIQELLQGTPEVTLFTRPRRFGKSLNMSMLRYFFEVGSDPALFEGLEISRHGGICEKYQGQHPVIFISLKDVKASNFDQAVSLITDVIRREALRHDILQGDKLGEFDKLVMRNLCGGMPNTGGSLLDLSYLLHKVYGKQVIVLIDEYDTPLQKAEQYGYYDEMAAFISTFLGACLKSNPVLAFAVVTGCSRVAKESIFSGLNNVVVRSALDFMFEEWFGFTHHEVEQLLNYYGCLEHLQIVKEWYDGYRFGDTQVYCPWDVMGWVDTFLRTGNPKPQNYWINTSDNQIITRFAEQADHLTRTELESLLRGDSIRKSLNLNFTYRELNKNISNMWSLFVLSGYLTVHGDTGDGYYDLKIPNKEILDTFQSMVETWFFDTISGNANALSNFFQALDDGDAKGLEKCLNLYLRRSISYFDSGSAERENFYHGFVLGLLQGRQSYIIKSNREGGEGRFDVAAYPEVGDFGIIFEFKYSDERDKLKEDAEIALQQIDQKQYGEFFEDGYLDKIIHFGIAFHKKRCHVVSKTIMLTLEAE